jgi:hypothetical protein
MEPFANNAVLFVLMIPVLATVQSPEFQVTWLVVELLMVLLLHDVVACAATGAIAASAAVKAKVNTVRRPAVNGG